MQKKALTLLLISTIVASIAIFPAASAGQQQYQKEYKELKFTVLTPEYDPIRVRIGDLLHMWGEEIGIDITNRPVDFSVEVDLVFTKWDYDMYIIGWGSRVMPWQFGKMFASWSHVPDGDNCEGFSNATYDALTNQSDVTIDREARKEQVFEMQEILAAELPTVGLYHRDMVEAVRAETTGWIFGVWGIDWAKSAESVEFVSGKERTVDGKVQLVAPIMDDMRKENIVDFGGTTWDAYPLDLVFQYLLTMDEKYDPMPYLAKNWSYTEDGLEWTFQLVDNATWHDGEPFTAEDVKFSIDYIMNNSAPWWVGELKYVEEVQIVDTHTVKIVL
ncbi:MAG: ABC transporter substrate-binding protein, partial [Candidatus Bathyarchaeia archaeon]